MTVVHVFHKEFLPSDTVFQLTRAVLNTRRPKALHQHDYYELLWVQNGKVRHYTTQGATDLTEGSLLFVRPDQPHALQGRGKDAMIVSVVFSPALIGALPEHFPDLSGKLFWSEAELPVCITCDMRQLAAINHAAVALEKRPQTSLSAMGFLAPLLSELTDSSTPLPENAPQWLTEACLAAQSPEVFRDGAAGLVRVAGRAHAHVSRTCRQYLCQSPSEFINEIRMTHAARQLAGSTDSLAEIAIDCGIPNLSHFHKLFLAHHGVTPAQFRKSRQHNTIQPDT